MTNVNKKGLLFQMQEVGHRIGTNAVMDFLESHGLEMDGVQLGFYVKDTSKVKWKGSSKFIKLYEMEMERLMNKEIINFEILGFLTWLSKYLNYEDNSLINKDGTYLTQKDIIEITGWHKNKVSKTVKSLIENEILYEKKQEEDKRKSKYFMNPNLFFKGKNIDKDIKEFYDNKKKVKD